MRIVRQFLLLIVLATVGCGTDDGIVDAVPPQQTTLLTVTGGISTLHSTAVSTIFFTTTGKPLLLVIEFSPVDETRWKMAVVYFAGVETNASYQRANAVEIAFDRSGRVNPSSSLIRLPFETSPRDEPLMVELNVRRTDQSSTVRISWQNGHQ